MKIIIPMAGRGSRFRELAHVHPEYAVPKPFIPVKGIPMIRWATASFPFLQQSRTDRTAPVRFSDLVFICLREDEVAYHVADQLRTLYGPEIHILFTPEVTRGAAETAYLAKSIIDTDEDIIISDSDHHFDATPLWHAIQGKDPGTVGVLPVIQPVDTKPTWSYVDMRGGRFVADVKEKDRTLAEQGAPGILGGYYFTHGRDFIAETEAMIIENDLAGEAHKQEFYVSQVYRRLLRRGAQIEIAPIMRGWVLGTPSQLEYFLSVFEGALPSYPL